MKLAILLFGHLRDFEKCAPTLKKYILDVYDCDLFMHTWDEFDHTTLSSHGLSGIDKKIDEEILANINNLYAPKGLLIEHQDKYEKEKVHSSSVQDGFKFSTSTLHFSFLSLQKANNLRIEYQEKNNIQYDYVLVTRPDVEFLSPFDIHNYIRQANILGLDLNKCRFFAASALNSHKGVTFYINEPNDILYFAKPDVITKYISINEEISDQYAIDHAVSVVTIYTSRELENDLMPVPISYTLGDDWTFLKKRKESDLDYIKMKGVKKIIAVIMKKSLHGLKVSLNKHKWL